MVMAFSMCVASRGISCPLDDFERSPSAVSEIEVGEKRYSKLPKSTGISHSIQPCIGALNAARH